MSDPVVSVIMPTYNRAHIVERAINSVLCQTLTDFELIVIDDASTDNTAEILGRYSDPRIRLIRRTANHLVQYRRAGVLDNPRNDGLKVARGKYISYLDDDDAYKIRFLEVMSSYLDVHPDIGLAFCDYTWHRNLSGRGEIADRYVSRDFDMELMKHTNLIGTLVTMHHRVVIDKVGFFKPFMVTTSYPGVPYAGQEDWDYWFRIAQHFKVKHVPVTLADKIHKSSIHYQDGGFTSWEIKR